MSLGGGRFTDVCDADPRKAANAAYLFQGVSTVFVGNDGGVDKDEARKIRVEWEDLKRVAEQFVLYSEMGRFSPGK